MYSKNTDTRNVYDMLVFAQQIFCVPNVLLFVNIPQKSIRVMTFYKFSVRRRLEVSWVFLLCRKNVLRTARILTGENYMHMLTIAQHIFLCPICSCSVAFRKSQFKLGLFTNFPLQGIWMTPECLRCVAGVSCVQKGYRQAKMICICLPMPKQTFFVPNVFFCRHSVKVNSS
jgi:hypothetical protein